MQGTNVTVFIKYLPPKRLFKSLLIIKFAAKNRKIAKS